MDEHVVYVFVQVVIVPESIGLIVELAEAVGYPLPQTGMDEVITQGLLLPHNTVGLQC